MVNKLLNATLIFTASLASAQVSAQCDVVKGQKVYKKCAACHTIEEGKHLMGPSLHGVVGRKAGVAEGYLYSLAMEESEITWDKKRLNQFLKNPINDIPGNSMPFAGIKKDQDRDDLICFLESVK